MKFGQVQLYTLRKEEQQAEILIALTRIVITFMVLIDALSHGFITGINISSRIWGTIAGILIAVFLYFDINKLSQERFAKFYGKWVKYFYITLDIVIVALMVHQGVQMERINSIFDIPLESFLSMVFMIPSALFLILGILRFSPYSTLYTIVGFGVAFIILVDSRGIYPEWQDWIFTEGKFNATIGIYFNALFILGTMCAFISWQLKKLMLRSKRQEDLERFLPEHVAREVMSGNQRMDSKGKKMRVTVLFSDIRGFTAMSEKETPEDLIDMLNTYLNDMIEIIFHHKGSIDKIMGDGIMAIYGAPLETDDAPENAVRTAIDMLRKLEDFNKIRELQNKEPLEIGIGIHTGDVILGNVGSERRMDFTAIGDTVNTASRLESLTKTKGMPIIISEITSQALSGKIKLQKLGSEQIRGNTDSIVIFGLGKKVSLK